MKLPRPFSEARARARGQLQNEEIRQPCEPEPQTAPSSEELAAPQTVPSSAELTAPQAAAAESRPLTVPERGPQESILALRALRILLCILVGMPLLVGVVLLLFALYLVAWTLIVAAYLLVFAMLLGTLALLALSVVRFGGNVASGLFLLGGGLVTAAAAALLLLGVNAFTPVPAHTVLRLYPKLQELVLLAWKGGADA